MTGPYANLFAVLAALALVHTVSGQCIAQLDTSTCLLIFPFGSYTSADCLSAVQKLTGGEGCNEYTFVETDDGNVCALKWEGCDASAVTYDGEPVDTCADDTVAAAGKLPYECSGSGPPSTGTPTPSSPSTGTDSEKSICIYQADYCGMLLQPLVGSGICDNIMMNLVKSLGSECSSWTYAESGELCYLQYLDDDSSCSGVQQIADALIASEGAKDNGECDSSLLPTADLTFTDGCSGAPTPDSPGTDSTDPPPDSSEPPSTSLTNSPPDMSTEYPPPAGSRDTPPGSFEPISPTIQSPTGALFTGAATVGSRVGIVFALALVAALAYAL